MPTNNPSLEDIWIVALKVDGSWVCDNGYGSGKGAWLNAKHFMNIGAARDAIAKPNWHNDPDGVRRAKPVKIRIAIKCEPY